ncbi:universal stress protein [Streptomyces sp. NPDC026672]|uniref:universal stress protein n=1 Tax=unclassified Streptomyces TaxID=2593676 RepID=UPI0033FE5EA8
MTTPPVIAAVDGSDDSLRALDWALDDARRRSAPVRVVHVRQYAPWAQPEVPVAAPPDGDDDPVLDRVRAFVKERAEGADAEYTTLSGAPAALLPELGDAAQLLVLGSRGRGGFASLLLGSNGLAAARTAACPVVVVPRPGRGTDDPSPVDTAPGPRVVVGVQVDDPDEGTLAFAFAEAAGRDARLQVIAAYPWPVQTWAVAGEPVPTVLDQQPVEDETRILLEEALAPHRARHPHVPSEAYALPGDAAGLLVAASRDAELVVVGRHRRRPLSPVRMLGSVTQAVLLHAASPIAVVPPAPTDEPTSGSAQESAGESAGE